MIIDEANILRWIPNRNAQINKINDIEKYISFRNKYDENIEKYDWFLSISFASIVEEDDVDENDIFVIKV